jgi:hypothetical protein
MVFSKVEMKVALLAYQMVEQEVVPLDRNMVVTMDYPMAVRKVVW